MTRAFCLRDSSQTGSRATTRIAPLQSGIFLLRVRSAPADGNHRTVLSVFSLVGYAMFVAQRLNIRIEYAIFNSTCGVISLLFAAGVFQFLTPVAWAIFFAGWILGSIAIGRAIWSRDRLPFSFGAALFTIACAGLYYLTRSGAFESWDEFSHWGTVIKHIWSVASLYKSQTLYFPDYPPALALFSFFVFIPWGFSEPDSLFASGVLVLSAGTVLAATSRWIGGALSFAIFYFLSFLFGAGLATVLIDFVLAAVFGAIICMYTQEVGNDDLTAAKLCVVPLSALVLVKAAGFPLATIVVLMIAIDGLVFRANKRRCEAARSILLTVAAVILPLLGWKVVMAIAGYESRTSRFSLLYPIRALLFEYPDRNAEVIWNAFKHGVTGGILFHNIKANLPTITASIIAVIAIGTIFSEDRRARLISSLVVIFGGAFYLHGLLATYMTNMSFYESSRLASFDRYLSVYLAAMAMFAVSMLVCLKSKKLAVAALVSVLWLSASWVPTDAFAFLKSGSRPRSEIRQDVLERLSPFRQENLQSKRVWIIWEGITGYQYWVVRYEILPARVNAGCWSVAPTKGEDEMYVCQRTEEQLAQNLTAFDALLVASSGEAFLRSYPTLFDSEPVYGRSMLFYVVKTGGTVKLKQVLGTTTSDTSNSPASSQSSN